MKKFRLKHLFKSESSLFALSTGLKTSGIFVAVAALVSYMLWLVLSLNNVFFESRGFMAQDALREAYFDSVLQSASNLFPYFVLLVVALFFGGVFLSKMLLRPFKLIGDYCDIKAEGKRAQYNPANFFDYKLLTRFSDFFFQYLDDSMREGRLAPNSLPPQFLGIHRPVFDRVFFFHMCALIAGIAVVAVTMLNMAAANIREDMADLAVNALSAHDYATSHFFQEQASLFDSINYVAVFLLCASYALLSFHLYGKVSGAVFGFFSTMRAFMKGDRKARVRLLGYNHVRPYGRSFNRYLKYIDAEAGRLIRTGNNQKHGLKYVND